jgi:dihydropteroate synthase
MSTTVFNTEQFINAGSCLVSLKKPLVMGILNVTPDSFYDGGAYLTEDKIVERVGKMLQEGADIIDVGGYSSRPGAEDIPVEKELQRVCEAVKLIKTHFSQAVISVDTFREQVAAESLKQGASIINDISGGELDKKMIPFITEAKVPYVMMHMRGTPRTMTKLTSYSNIIQEIIAYFYTKINKLKQAGVNDIIVDPGFGFAKNAEQNFLILKKLSCFKVLDVPVLVGISRKSMIYKTLNIVPEEALNGTTALHMVALQNGADILRVHDVKEAVQTVKLFEKLQNIE